MEKLRRNTIRAPWLQPLILAAKVIELGIHEDLDEIYLGKHQVLRCTGRFPEHTDIDFPQWSYMLVLRANGGILFSGDNEPLVLKPGMLVEMDAHLVHRLDAPRDHILIWYPADSDIRVDLKEAKAWMVEAFTSEGSVVHGYEIEARENSFTQQAA